MFQILYCNPDVSNLQYNTDSFQFTLLCDSDVSNSPSNTYLSNSQYNTPDNTNVSDLYNNTDI